MHENRLHTHAQKELARTRTKNVQICTQKACARKHEKNLAHTHVTQKNLAHTRTKKACAHMKRACAHTHEKILLTQARI